MSKRSKKNNKQAAQKEVEATHIDQDEEYNLIKDDINYWSNKVSFQDVEQSSEGRLQVFDYVSHSTFAMLDFRSVLGLGDFARRNGA